jgi:DNA-binding MarR family transcriptional regulator
LDKSAIVTILDELEARGLAVRGRSREDRRRNALFLTRRGEELTAEMAVVAHESEEPLRGALAPDELEKLLELLDRAYAALASG